MRKEIGVIESVQFGLGGYQECEMGLSLTFTFKGSGVCAFISGGWATERSEYTKWTEDDRVKAQHGMCMKIIKILRDAKVYSVANLKGKPVECEFDGMVLKDWRILTEAIL